MGLSLNRLKASRSNNMYLIAEIGSNHGGSMRLAKRLIDEARSAGASAVKFQSWTPESLYSLQYLRENPDIHRELSKHSLSIKKLRYLAGYAAGIDFICSVFSRKEVDALVDVLDIIKVASMDLNNTRLLKHIASMGKPTIISVGMGEHIEILEACNIFYGIPHTLLHCVSLYPPKDDQIVLSRMRWLKKFAELTGYSDHTTGITACLAAVALGAVCIEKHFTLDKTMKGWDHHISADPKEFQSLVKQADMITEMLQDGLLGDLEQRATMRRSLVANKDLKAGHELVEDDVIWRRPGTGLQELGTLKVDVAEGQMLTREDVE